MAINQDSDDLSLWDLNGPEDEEISSIQQENESQYPFPLRGDGWINLHTLARNCGISRQNLSPWIRHLAQSDERISKRSARVVWTKFQINKGNTFESKSEKELGSSRKSSQEIPGALKGNGKIRLGEVCRVLGISGFDAKNYAKEAGIKIVNKKILKDEARRIFYLHYYPHEIPGIDKIDLSLANENEKLTLQSDDDKSPVQASEKATTIQILDRNLLDQSADFYTYYSSLPKDSRPRPDSFSYKGLQTLFEKQKKQGVNHSHSTGYTSKDQKLVGQEILKLCLDGFSEGIAETSLCIRSGYKTDNIGQFRRAFSKAAHVPFGPLSRMIADLRKKKDKNKERIRNHPNHQDYSDSKNKPISTEKEFDEVITERRMVEIRSTSRVRNAGFRSAVLKNFLYTCACCGIDIPELLEAAHIVPVANDGNDHPSNGIALCPTHHSAFDRHYFTFEPGSRKLILKAGLTTSQLLITKEILEADINDECLALRQRLFNTEASD